MKEAYCSYEISKLIKEKGFDWTCISYYVDYEPNDVKYSMLFEDNTTWEERCCSAPTHQMACAWLRERNIGIVPEIHTTQDPKNYYWSAYIFYLNKPWDILHYVSEPSKNVIDGYNSVIEQALKYTLENLI